MEHKELDLHELESIVGGFDRLALDDDQSAKINGLIIDYEAVRRRQELGLADKLAVDKAFADVLAYAESVKKC